MRVGGIVMQGTAAGGAGNSSERWVARVCSRESAQHSAQEHALFLDTSSALSPQQRLAGQGAGFSWRHAVLDHLVWGLGRQRGGGGSQRSERGAGGGWPARPAQHSSQLAPARPGKASKASWCSPASVLLQPAQHVNPVTFTATMAPFQRPLYTFP